MAEISLDHLLTFCVQQGGSDLLLKAGQPPIIRLHGDLVRMKMEPLSPEVVRRLSFAVITDEQIARFERNWELDYAYEILTGSAAISCSNAAGQLCVPCDSLPYSVR